VWEWVWIYVLKTMGDRSVMEKSISTRETERWREDLWVSEHCHNVPPAMFPCSEALDTFLFSARVPRNRVILAECVYLVRLISVECPPRMSWDHLCKLTSGPNSLHSLEITSHAHHISTCLNLCLGYYYCHYL